MRIFFLHGVSAFGGSTKSLLELFTQLKVHGIEGTVLCPAGKSEKFLSSNGMTTHTVLGISQFNNTLFSYYRGLRWLILIRELWFFLPTVLGLLRVKLKSKNFDVIHANEITLLPVAILAKKIFKCPLVVHVRSLQRGHSKDLRSRTLFKLLKKYADSVIAIDKTVRASLPDDISVNVVHNGINLTETPCYERTAPLEVLRIGIVGMLIPIKGIYEFLNAAKILIERGLIAEFVVVGENARTSNQIWTWFYKKLGFSTDVMRDLLEFIKVNNLEQYFDVKGFILDVASIYSNLDVLCFPCHVNALGRPVFEAALFGVPSIVALKEPEDDTIIDKETGICIENPTAIALAEAIAFFLENPEERVRMGNNAQNFASSIFNINENAKKVVGIYHNVLLN